MKPDLVPANAQQKGILRRLRPPCARPTRLVYSYSHSPPNFGMTLAIPSGQGVIAPGAGIVEQVVSVAAKWRFTSPSYHDTSTSLAVVIHHGQEIRTVVHGLSSVTVSGAQTIGRGTFLGVPAASEVFFGIQTGTNYSDPARINRHFVARDGFLVAGQGGFIKQAPDILVQAAGTVASVLSAGLRYFVTCEPILVNVDFNGNGSKTGAGVAGGGAADYWNVYVPADFSSVISYNCGTGAKTFNITPLLALKDYTGTGVPIYLERIDPLVAAAGTASAWDEMLKTWIGGYTGPTPYENTFTFHGFPTGSYQIYAYANQGAPPNASTFYLSVNGGTPTVKSNTPTATTAFVEDGNYARFPVSLISGDRVTIKVFGYLSGLQFYRA